MSQSHKHHEKRDIPAIPADDLLAVFAERFVQRTRPFAVQQADGTYRWRYEDLNAAHLLQHLTGELTLALTSSDADARTRWVCLDVDDAAPNALERLLAVRRALAALDIPGLVEASRRGGHLWLFFETPIPVAAARIALLVALDDVCALWGVPAFKAIPAYELYPDMAAAMSGTLGHAMRLPLGIHQLTGKRYPLFDADGHPCAFTSLDAALRFLVICPALATSAVLAMAARAETFGVKDTDADAGAAGGAAGERRSPGGQPGGAPVLPGDTGGPRGTGGKVGTIGTRSAVIRWIDAHVSALDLLAQLAPESEMKRSGQGYLGWCPFHDDRERDELGRPGTKSFYLVHDRRYGWSWRCLSTNCSQHDGPMRHSFRLFQELTGLTVKAAIVEAISWWIEAAEADEASEPGEPGESGESGE